MKPLLLAIVLMAATWSPAQTSVAGAGGSATQPVVSKSANYTATIADFSAANTLMFNCAGSCDATLPSPVVSNGLFIAVKNNGTNSIFVMPNGLTLDGNAAPVLVAPGSSVRIWSDGSNYFSGFGQVTVRRWSREESALAALNVIGTSITTTANSINASVATSAESFFEILATSATLNNAADSVELTGKWGMGSAAFNAKFSGRFGFDDAAAGVTTSRAFLGMIDQAATTANYFGVSSSDTPTQNALLFRCSSSVPDANWMAMVTKNGAGATTASTGVACNTSNHTFVIQEHGGNTAYFYIDGVMRVCIGADAGCTAGGGNYPPFAAARMMSGVTTLAAAIHNFHFFWMQMESDF